MAKATSKEWKIGNRILDLLYPEPESELNEEDLIVRKETLGQIVREISSNRDDETKRCAWMVECLAADFGKHMMWTAAFETLKVAFAMDDREYPIEPEKYLEWVHERRQELAREELRSRERQHAEVYVKR